MTQALCDVCAVATSEVTAAACRLPGNPAVINLEPSSLEDVFQCIRMVGDAAGVSDRATMLVERLQQRVQRVCERSAGIERRPRVVLLEWIDPPFSSGHWSPELVRMAGGEERIGVAGSRSRTTDWSDIVQADPEVLVIACCGFDVARTLEDIPTLVSLPGFTELSCVRNQQVYVVDGNAYFSRPAHGWWTVWRFWLICCIPVCTTRTRVSAGDEARAGVVATARRT